MLTPVKGQSDVGVCGRSWARDQFQSWDVAYKRDPKKSNGTKIEPNGNFLLV